MFPERNDLDGSYLLFANENVTIAEVLSGHIERTAARCAAKGDVLILSDTTDVAFGGAKRKGLGYLTNGGAGFLAHVSMAVTEEDGRPLGLMAAEFWTRESKGKRTYAAVQKDPERESRVWLNGIRASEKALAGRARVIHVMDRAADIYEQLIEMDTQGCCAVIRAQHNRPVQHGDDQTKLWEAVGSTECMLTRKVFLSARKGAPFPKNRRRHPPRSSRDATLQVRATTVAVKRPTNHSKTPKSVDVTVVSVTEPDPPDGLQPVEWVLLTNLPARTAAEAARVVDIYRKRWVIEEFFKALKTGCAVETRQLETVRSLMNATAFFMPVAAQMLELRTQARASPQLPATTVCTQDQLDVLRRVSTLKIPKAPTVRDALLAVAKLGGHLKSNGDPGWQVLARGWLKLLNFIEMKNLYDQSQRSTES